MKKALYKIFFHFTLGFSLFGTQGYQAQNTLNQQPNTEILVAYPHNTSRSSIILKTQKSQIKIKRVVFYSIVGVEVYAINLNTNYAEISMDRLTPGKYLMRYILSDGSDKITQIIKR